MDLAGSQILVIFRPGIIMYLITPQKYGIKISAILTSTMGIIMFLFILASIVLPVVALVDILRNEFKGSDKLIWVLIVLFLPILGSILYLIMGSRQKTV